MIKIFFDFSSSLVGLIVLMPILLLIGLLIKLDSEGPIFFIQERVGRDGSIFKIFKLRTMQLNSEKNGDLTIGNDKRITRIGYYLRKYKIDELPQLINVIKGDMSIVGPRPEVERYIETYSKEEKEKILSIKPGITDIASLELIDENKILGEYKNPEEAYLREILQKKKKIHQEYVKNNSFIQDLKIIFLTIKKIII